MWIYWLIWSHCWCIRAADPPQLLALKVTAVSECIVISEIFYLGFVFLFSMRKRLNVCFVDNSDDYQFSPLGWSVRVFLSVSGWNLVDTFGGNNLVEWLKLWNGWFIPGEKRQRALILLNSAGSSLITANLSSWSCISLLCSWVYDWWNLQLFYTIFVIFESHSAHDLVGGRAFFIIIDHSTWLTANNDFIAASLHILLTGSTNLSQGFLQNCKHKQLKCYLSKKAWMSKKGMLKSIPWYNILDTPYILSQ